MAFLLSEYAKLEKDDLKAGIIMTILRYSQVMDQLKWENIGALKQEATRWNTLPTTAFRKIGGAYASSEGTYDQVWESLYAFGGKLTLDRVYDLTSNVLKDPRADQIEMKLKSKAMTFNHYYINGDHATDGDGFEGLKKRVSLMPARQTVYASASDAAPLDPTSSVANARAYLDAIDKSIKYCNAGQCDAIYLNENSYLGFTSVVRYAQVSGGNMMDITKDSFDRTIMTYAGKPLIDVGLQSDMATEIISDTELDGTNTNLATSLYFVSYDSLEGVNGIQLKDMDILDDVSSGPLQPAKVLDWFCGLASWGKYGIVRLANVESKPNWT
jgi:hypothetical protein